MGNNEIKFSLTCSFNRLVFTNSFSLEDDDGEKAEEDNSKDEL